MADPAVMASTPAYLLGMHLGSNEHGLGKGYDRTLTAAHSVANEPPGLSRAMNRVAVRSDPEAIAFLRQNNALGATLDANTVAVDPTRGQPSDVLAHEMGHVAQLRSGRSAPREAAERGAADYARGATIDPGGAAQPPLFQLAPAPNIPSNGFPLAGEMGTRATREDADLGKMGQRMAGAEDRVEVSADKMRSLVGDHILIAIDVSATREKGEVQSSTVFKLHVDEQPTFASVIVGPPEPRDPKDMLLTAADLEGRGPASLAPAVDVELYPIVLSYSRTTRIKDRDGRVCEIHASSVVQFTRERWEEATAGRTPSTEALRLLVGSKAMTWGGFSGGSAVLQYSSGGGSSATSIDAAIAEVQVAIEGEQELGGAPPLPASFVRPERTAGEQFDELERLLIALDQAEVARLAKLPLIDFSGADDEDGDDDSGFELPGWLKGILNSLPKIGFTVIVLAAFTAVVAAIVALPFEVVAVVVVASAIAAAYLTAIFLRSVESAETGTGNAASIVSSAVLDTIGAGDLYQGATNQSLLSGRDLGLSEEERWEAGTSGLLNLGMTVLGARSPGRGPGNKPSTLKGEPGLTPEPVARTTPARVEASQFLTPEAYLDAIRNGPDLQSPLGQGWDNARFPQGPRRAWQPADPIDMPSPRGIYPTFNTVRGRAWRNRAALELEARSSGARTQGAHPSDPISMATDAELVTLRDTPTNSVRAPRDASGRPMEIEHFGVPQRVGGWLESAGFSRSEARRLSDIGNPDKLLEVTGPEHAFFDAPAQGFGRQRADSSGRMWDFTQMADERVARPLVYMSDARLIEISNRARGPGINLANTPQLRQALRAEAALRGLLLVF